MTTLLLLSWAILAASSDGGATFVTTAELVAPSCTVEVVGDTPLPYQAVRLRQKFSNRDATPINAQVSVIFLAIRRAGAVDYQPIADAVQTLEPGMGLPAITRRIPANPDGIIQLTNGESLSETQASASQLLIDRRVPMFPEPGEYRISWTGTNDYGRNVLVTVQAPEGADAAIYRLLQQDELLARAIIAPMNIPDSQTVAQLEAIVRQSPHSTYADYARFALARAKLRGWGRQALNDALYKSLDHAAKELYKFLSDPRTQKRHIVWRVESLLYRHDPLRGQELRATEELEAARNGTENDRRKAAERWAPDFYVSADDRAAALAWLRQITRPGFAFRPHTLVIESRLLRIEQMLVLRKADTGPIWQTTKRDQLFCEFQHPTVKPVTDILNRDYRDSIEWIDEVLCSIKTEQEWRAFRVQPAPAAKDGGNGKE